MRVASPMVSVLLLVVASASSASDNNLLPNGDFSQSNQLAGWSCLGATWSSDDATSIGGSGSMSLENTGNNAGSCTSSCIAVRPGAAFSLGGQSRVLFGNPVIAFACAPTSVSQCNNFTFDLLGPPMSTANAWNAVAASTSGILANNTVSLKCKLTLSSADLGSVSAHFDNLFFTTDVIFYATFESL